MIINHVNKGCFQIKLLDRFWQENGDDKVVTFCFHYFVYTDDGQNSKRSSGGILAYLIHTLLGTWLC